MGRPRRSAGERVAIALGSNLGDRGGHLRWALDALAGHLTSLRASPFANTVPVDVSGAQPDYLNAVAVGRTTLEPQALLDLLSNLEVQRGRTRPTPRAPRTLDLDLILYGSRIVDDARLTVPHPRFRERPFVLGPLAALAPRWRDPVSGRTLAALWKVLAAANRSSDHQIVS